MKEALGDWIYLVNFLPVLLEDNFCDSLTLFPVLNVSSEGISG